MPKSAKESGISLPESVAGIQVNICRDGLCPAFAADWESLPAGDPLRPKFSRNGNEWRVACPTCGTITPIRDNSSISDFLRLQSHDRLPVGPVARVRNVRIGYGRWLTIRTSTFDTAPN